MTSAEVSASSRKKRKEEGKLKKRQRIEDSGGVRPRHEKSVKNDHHDDAAASSPANDNRQSSQNNDPMKQTSHRSPKGAPSNHRFGRVMETVPCRNRPRFSTVSIAVPGSVLSNCQTKELRTLMVGQIARAATIYHVDEIIVFDDKLGRKDHRRTDWRNKQQHDKDTSRKEPESQESNVTKEEDKSLVKEEEMERRPRSTPEEFMARLLQYCECPQYLRRLFFPMHPDLHFAGLLAPVDAPHHVRAEDHSPYREGSVLVKKSKDGGSLVNCGIRNRPVE